MILVALAIAACGLRSTAPAQGITGAGYTCHAFPFDPRSLAQTGVAERADVPSAAALRAHLASQGEGSGLPPAGWHLAGSDASRAEYVATAATSYVSALVELVGGAWTVVSWGGCEPEMMFAPNVRAATWSIAPEGELLHASSTAILVEVHERSCASGRSPEGRVVGPQIEYDETVIRIAFGVIVPHGDQECPGSPSARLEVRLAQPLGNRVISDVGVWPPTNQWAPD